MNSKGPHWPLNDPKLTAEYQNTLKRNKNLPKTSWNDFKELVFTSEALIVPQRKQNWP